MNYQIIYEFNFVSIILRLLLSLILGSTIGIDRSRKGSPAGLKTHSLVCMGSTLIMLTSQFCYVHFGIGDITRLPAQVISGIGFLGAGTILVTHRDQIKGLTSAASIWFSASIGLAVGIGFYSGAFVAALLEFFIFKLLSKSSFLPEKKMVVDLFLEFNDQFDLGTFLEVLKKYHIDLLLSEQQSFKSVTKRDNLQSVLLSVRVPIEASIDDLLVPLKNIKGVLRVIDF